MTGNIAEQANLLTYPNQWLNLMEFMQDPARLQQYFSSRCETQTVQVSNLTGEDYTASRFLSNVTDVQTLPEGFELRVCKDNFGAWDAYNQCASSNLCVVC